jgi:predicted AlkP superfamily pyrophosphatase or phosphodiesterase
MRPVTLVLRNLASLLIFFCVVVPANATNPPREKQSVVVILLDGFRSDSVTPANTPNLARLAKSGVTGDMIPVWPTVSIPNHWALATGLYPEHSGVLNNSMYNPKTGKLFALQNYESDWATGEPIWAAVVRQGGIAGSVGGWFGSHFRDGPYRPSFMVPYGVAHVPDITIARSPDSSMMVGPDNRAEMVLDILDQDPATRPDLLALYVIEVDELQHEHGVHSPQANKTITQVDSMIGRLVDGLATRHLSDKVNIVIVADHGQMSIEPDHLVYLDDLFDLNKLVISPVSAYSPVVGLWPKPGMAEEIYKQLQTATGHFHAYKAADIPARFHAYVPGRTPPISLVFDAGYIGVVRGQDPFGPGVHGSHGFDNSNPEMHPVFIAAGPGIRAGIEIKPFNNVDVYSLLAQLLHIEPAKTDGTLNTFCDALIERPPSCGGSQPAQ